MRHELYLQLLALFLALAVQSLTSNTFNGSILKVNIGFQLEVLGYFYGLSSAALWVLLKKTRITCIIRWSITIFYIAVVPYVALILWPGFQFMVLRLPVFKVMVPISMIIFVALLLFLKLRKPDPVDREDIVFLGFITVCACGLASVLSDNHLVYALVLSIGFGVLLGVRKIASNNYRIALTLIYGFPIFLIPFLR